MLILLLSAIVSIIDRETNSNLNLVLLNPILVDSSSVILVPKCLFFKSLSASRIIISPLSTNLSMHDSTTLIWRY